MNTRAKTVKPTKSSSKNVPLDDSSLDMSDIDMSISPNPRGQHHVTSDATTPVTPSMSDLATLITSAKIATEANNKQLNDKLDTLIIDVSYLKTEISGIKETVSELEASANVASGRIDDIENRKIPDALSKIEKVKADLEEKLILYEIHERKLNLLVYGVRVSQNENVYRECFAVFSSLLNISPEEAAHMIPLTNAHRLPRRAATNDGAGVSQQPRPYYRTICTHAGP